LPYHIYGGAVNYDESSSKIPRKMGMDIILFVFTLTKSFS